MQLFSIPIKTRIIAGTSHAGASLLAGMESAKGLIQSIEFEPNECANLRCGRGDEFSEELV